PHSLPTRTYRPMSARLEHLSFKSRSSASSGRPLESTPAPRTRGARSCSRTVSPPNSSPSATHARDDALESPAVIRPFTPVARAAEALPPSRTLAPRLAATRPPATATRSVVPFTPGTSLLFSRLLPHHAAIP